MKKILCVTMLITLIMGGISTTPVRAEDMQEQQAIVEERDGVAYTVMPRWTYISIIGTMLDVDSGGKASCHTSMNSRDSSYVCKISASLLQLKSGYFKEIATWNTKEKGGASITGVRYVSKGSYQLTSTCEVWNSANTKLLESETVTDSDTY